MPSAKESSTRTPSAQEGQVEASVTRLYAQVHQLVDNVREVMRGLTGYQEAVESALLHTSAVEVAPSQPTWSDTPSRPAFICTTPEDYRKVAITYYHKYIQRRSQQPGAWTMPSLCSLRNYLVCLLRKGHAEEAALFCDIVVQQMSQSHAVYSPQYFSIMIYQTICHYVLRDERRADTLFALVTSRPAHLQVDMVADDLEVLQWFRIHRTVTGLPLRESWDAVNHLLRKIKEYEDALQFDVKCDFPDADYMAAEKLLGVKFEQVSEWRYDASGKPQVVDPSTQAISDSSLLVSVGPVSTESPSKSATTTSPSAPWPIHNTRMAFLDASTKMNVKFRDYVWRNSGRPHPGALCVPNP